MFIGAVCSPDNFIHLKGENNEKAFFESFLYSTRIYTKIWLPTWCWCGKRSTKNVGSVSIERAEESPSRYWNKQIEIKYLEFEKSRLRNPTESKGFFLCCLSKVDCDWTWMSHTFINAKWKLFLCVDVSWVMLGPSSLIMHNEQNFVSK